MSYWRPVNNDTIKPEYHGVVRAAIQALGLHQTAPTVQMQECQAITCANGAQVFQDVPGRIVTVQLRIIGEIVP